jgi:pectate lyase
MDRRTRRWLVGGLVLVVVAVVAFGVTRGGGAHTPVADTSAAPEASAALGSVPAASGSPSASVSPSRPGSPLASASASGPAPRGWPAPAGEASVRGTVKVSGVFDGGLKRYCCVGDGGQSESQDPMFELADGATLQNVIIGSPAGDGVHCLGNCTLRNVWWEDVGEDAATFLGSSGSARRLVDGGGARGASDKVFQHNGAGTLTIRGFQVSNFGKLYRSCGNCTTQHARHVVIEGVVATAPGKAIVGINVNYGDTATISRLTIVGDGSRKVKVCDKFTGNSSGAEPTGLGSGPDGTNCRYTTADVTYK